MKVTVATLITSHNRKIQTLECLYALFENRSLPKCEFTVFLVDDGSSDNTAEVVSSQFPIVNIIKGNGSLFWNQGMRLAWETALKIQDYDFYFWLNDDTVLDNSALLDLLEAQEESMKMDGKFAIITSACRESDTEELFSYGGRNDTGPVIPNGKLQTCKYINGNAVLVPKEIFNSIGILCSDYQHMFGDHDYGLRAINAGFKCYTTKSYIATCPSNKGLPTWCNPKTPLAIRWKLFHSPKGLNIQDYLTYKRKFWGKSWMVSAVKAYMKMLFPSIYKIIAKQ